MTKRAATAVVLAATGIGCLLTGGVFAKGQSGNMLTPADKQFMKMVGEGNVAEVQLGQLAEKRGGAAVKKVATTLVQDHSKGEAQLKQVAAKKGVTLPKSPNAKHRALMAKLSRLSGAAFDLLFVSTQLSDHVTTVKAFNSETVKVEDPDLKNFVLVNLPPIQGHTQMLAQIHAEQTSGKKSGNSGMAGM